MQMLACTDKMTSPCSQAMPVDLLGGPTAADGAEVSTRLQSWMQIISTRIVLSQIAQNNYFGSLAAVGTLPGHVQNPLRRCKASRNI